MGIFKIPSQMWQQSGSELPEKSDPVGSSMLPYSDVLSQATGVLNAAKVKTFNFSGGDSKTILYAVGGVILLVVAMSLILKK